MPETKPLLARTARGSGEFEIGVASGVWLLTWLIGNLIGSLILGITGHAGGGPQPLWVSVVGAVCLWGPMLAGLWVLSVRLGSGSIVADYRLRFEPIDLIGIPIGVLS